MEKRILTIDEYIVETENQLFEASNFKKVMKLFV